MFAPLRTGPWNLSDLKDVPKNGLKVFSCFHCGGGSTMGYKLAGYDVLGGVEIDPKMMQIYRQNHNPKHSYLMGVQDFKNIPNDKLPKELFELDILDGSPPCSSFSMAGSREKAWSKKKKFREGQADQVLDDLFFHFIDVAKKLQPKVVVAENVKGLIQGNARGYVKEIFAAFRDAGYDCQLFLLNAAVMGVPQRRERTFFIANRLGKKIKLQFNEDQINLKTAFKDLIEDESISISGKVLERWKNTKPGSFAKAASGNTFGFLSKESPDKPASTQTGNPRNYHWKYKRLLNSFEALIIQSFPDDYKAKNTHYICGMSVPPFMMQRVADQIYKQFFI